MDQAIEDKGILSNAAFVLGLTAGRELPQDTYGDNVVDGSGSTHKYLTQIGHFVRKAGQNKIKTIRKECFDKGIMVVDYTNDAAPADYAEYTRTIATHGEDALQYRAVWIYGPEEIVYPLTKNLSKLS